MKGLMVQEGLTMDEALKLMEEGQKVPDRKAPTLPPRVLGMYVYTIITLLLCINYQSCYNYIHTGSIIM